MVSILRKNLYKSGFILLLLIFGQLSFEKLIAMDSPPQPKSRPLNMQLKNLKTNLTTLRSKCIELSGRLAALKDQLSHSTGIPTPPPPPPPPPPSAPNVGSLHHEKKLGTMLDQLRERKPLKKVALEDKPYEKAAKKVEKAKKVWTDSFSKNDKNDKIIFETKDCGVQIDILLDVRPWIEGEKAAGNPRLLVWINAFNRTINKKEFDEWLTDTYDEQNDIYKKNKKFEKLLAFIESDGIKSKIDEMRKTNLPLIKELDKSVAILKKYKEEKQEVIRVVAKEREELIKKAEQKIKDEEAKKIQDEEALKKAKEKKAKENELAPENKLTPEEAQKKQDKEAALSKAFKDKLQKIKAAAEGDDFEEGSVRKEIQSLDAETQKKISDLIKLIRDEIKKINSYVKPSGEMKDALACEIYENYSKADHLAPVDLKLVNNINIDAAIKVIAKYKHESTLKNFRKLLNKFEKGLVPSSTGAGPITHHSKPAGKQPRPLPPAPK